MSARNERNQRIPDVRLEFGPEPNVHRANGRDPFPDRAPLDHVPVYPARKVSRWPGPVLLVSLGILGAGALAGCWPW